MEELIKDALKYNNLVRDLDLKCEFLGFHHGETLKAERALTKFEGTKKHRIKLESYRIWIEKNLGLR